MAMNEAMKGSSLSREQVADEMNRRARLAGMRFRSGKAMLDKWLNLAAENYPPPLLGRYLFCLALGDNRPLEAYVLAFPEVRLVSQEDAELLAWAKTEKASLQTRRQARHLALKVGME